MLSILADDVLLFILFFILFFILSNNIFVSFKLSMELLISLDDIISNILYFCKDKVVFIIISLNESTFFDINSNLASVFVFFIIYYI